MRATNKVTVSESFFKDAWFSSDIPGIAFSGTMFSIEMLLVSSEKKLQAHTETKSSAIAAPPLLNNF